MWTQATLFRLLSARMDWLGQRQGVLNRNIANADTPDFAPKDLRAADFERLAAGVAGRPSRLALAASDPRHLSGRPAARLGLDGKAQRPVYEVAPAGNAVVLEEQMTRAAETALDFQLMTNLYRKQVGMVRTALGAPGA
jgi:flagellar basal-body rod protein FlgB